VNLFLLSNSPQSEVIMNKDRVEGKVKDVAGRVQRQVGEWTGDTEAQVKGAVKQAEGKTQNAWGKVKDAVKKPADSEKSGREESGDLSAEEREEERRASRHSG
jgi:uncharacterized protein YjbJ (UPF0337 family)